MANSYQQRVQRRQLSAADYLGSRGADGIDALRRLVSETEASDGDGQALVRLPRNWQCAIPLKGACMNGHVRTLAYLVDACRADVDLVDEETGDTAAHVAVSWGRLDAVAWLLVPVWKSNLRRVRSTPTHWLISTQAREGRAPRRPRPRGPHARRRGAAAARAAG